MSRQRKIFMVVVDGRHETQRHYHDTIKTKRSIQEFGRFLAPAEANIIERYSPLSVWGSIPGPMNVSFWKDMEPGDYMIVYQQRKIIQRRGV